MSMPRVLKSLLLAGAAGLTLPVLAWAHDDHGHDHGHREAGAHVHGISRMDLVVDGSMVGIDLTSPAADIVGFEHPPGDDHDEATIRAAMEKLRDTARLFVFPDAAACDATRAEVSADQLGGRQGHGHDHEGQHADFHAEYRFECGNPGALDGMTIRLFESFGNAEQLTVQVITPQRQSRVELTPQRNRVRF